MLRGDVMRSPSRSLVISVNIVCVGFLLGFVYWAGRDLGNDAKAPLDLFFWELLAIAAVILPLMGWFARPLRLGFLLVFVSVMIGSLLALIPQRHSTPVWPACLVMAAFEAFACTVLYALGSLLAARRYGRTLTNSN